MEKLQSTSDLSLVESWEFMKKWEELFRKLFKDNEYLRNFIENDDHGLAHCYNVYKTASNLLSTLSEEEQARVNKETMEIMVLFHDIGRFHHPKCDRRHQKCGMAQVRMYAQKTGMDEETRRKIIDLVKYHDFMSKDLDPNQREPYSIEWQIVRLADKMSVDPIAELRRYWDYGKRIGSTLLDETISMDDRLNFSFDKRGKVKTDQLTYFLALLATSPDSISQEKLRDNYVEWSKNKNRAEEEIYHIMGEEWFSIEKILQVRTIISVYKTSKHLQF